MIPIGSHPAWHPVFEVAAYVVGYLVFRRAARRYGDPLPDEERWRILAAAAVGALVGSRLLGLVEQFPTILAGLRDHRALDLLFAPGGKTIVGGLLGGWLGVELVKRFTGMSASTGDILVLPLCIGIAIGRIGCFFAGIADDTYGKPTQLPWAVDFGDGIGRHPTQLYEMLFLLALAALLSRPWNLPSGARFRIFLAAYLAWRLLIDFLKPQPLLFGLNCIQWACAAGLAALAISAFSNLRALRRKQTPHATPA
ncbi:MAG TPA: prolipoprotein diacylglyceryl transferase family protein [Terracidiphilus sp.]|nr:prolipoprotein diacylglyceryl transferase family protein [Terracidiphilus sp.]